MTLAALWLHVLGVIVWMGGVMYQAHVLLPMARRGHVAAFAAAARRGRPVAWTALALVVLTGFYNVTRLGPLDRVMQSGAAMLLAGKFGLVLVLAALAGRRDFGEVPGFPPKDRWFRPSNTPRYSRAGGFQPKPSGPSA